MMLRRGGCLDTGRSSEYLLLFHLTIGLWVEGSAKAPLHLQVET